MLTVLQSCSLKSDGRQNGSVCKYVLVTNVYHMKQSKQI